MASAALTSARPPRRGRELVENLVNLLGRQRFVVGLVDLHHWCGTTRGQALRRAQRDLTVRRRLPDADTEALLAMLENLVAASQRTRERAADPDLVLARRVLVEQRIEGDDALHVRRAQLETR